MLYRFHAADPILNQRDVESNQLPVEVYIISFRLRCEEAFGTHGSRFTLSLQLIDDLLEGDSRVDG